MSLVKDLPRHPYELMQSLGDKNGGSAKSLFPVLQSLCDEGLVGVDVDFGWRTYWLTEAGKAELEAGGENPGAKGTFTILPAPAQNHTPM
jgi:DNA-binding PadR family transcriptional regulator